MSENRYPQTADFAPSQPKTPDPRTFGKDMLEALRVQLDVTRKEHELQVARCHDLESRVALLSDLHDNVLKVLERDKARTNEKSTIQELAHIPAGSDRFA